MDKIKLPFRQYYIAPDTGEFIFLINAEGVSPVTFLKEVVKVFLLLNPHMLLNSLRFTFLISERLRNSAIPNPVLVDEIIEIHPLSLIQESR